MPGVRARGGHHLVRLAHPERSRDKHPGPPRQQVRSDVRELLTAMEGVPAYVWGRRSDVLAWNNTASAVFGDWSARAPEDAQLASLIGELSMKSEEFRKLWAAHDVKKKTHGTMRLTHPLVGGLTLRYETLALPGDQDQSLTAYHAEPGSPSEEALRLSASWGVDAAQPSSADRSHQEGS
ncbi:MmyB family transcriptional regulator [Actinacidiphila alni]|uniref:MmyB family transcriptional regulator n=1 Tax=Actinacidiphila alni TaxID=380248 RepID=UPI003F502881